MSTVGTAPGVEDREPDGLASHRLPVAGPLTALRSMLPRRDVPLTVVVLADDDARSVVGAWLDEFPDQDVHVMSPTAVPEWGLDRPHIVHHIAGTVGMIEWQLKLIGSIDVLVDLVSHDEEVADKTWRRLFFHLRPGGVYLIDRATAGDVGFSPATQTWVGALLGAATTDVTTVSRVSRELSDSTASVVLSRDGLALVKRQKHFVKLTDAETNRMLPSREADISLDVLARLPAGDIVARGRTFSHRADVEITWLEDRLAHPTLFLRHYTGRIALAGGTFMYGDSTILPDSFRRHLEGDMRNPKMTNVNALFARIPPRVMPKATLAGNYYQLDCAYSGHFGHLMTEVISRLWGWDQAKALYPDLKAIFMIRYALHRDPVVERRLFEAFGIPPDDIVVADHPVYLESVVSASPMWHNAAPHYVHPQMGEVLDRLGRAMIDTQAPLYDRIFVSRQGSERRRNCRNARDVERYFAARGFTVLYPELLDMSEQAGIFAQATTIAGFGGSAMFNIAYAKRVETLIVLSHEAYTARNEHLFGLLLDCDHHYFWSPPDVSHPPGRRTQEAFDSDWEFDFDRNEGELDDVIAGLRPTS